MTHLEAKGNILNEFFILFASESIPMKGFLFLHCGGQLIVLKVYLLDMPIGMKAHTYFFNLGLNCKLSMFEGFRMTFSHTYFIGVLSIIAHKILFFLLQAVIDWYIWYTFPLHLVLFTHWLLFNNAFSRNIRGCLFNVLLLHDILLKELSIFLLLFPILGHFFFHLWLFVI